MDVGRLTLTARQQSNSKWELSRAAVNSEPYHEPLFLSLPQHFSVICQRITRFYVRGDLIHLYSFIRLLLI